MNYDGKKNMRNKKTQPISQKNENLKNFCSREVDELREKYKLKELRVKLKSLDMPLGTSCFFPDDLSGRTLSVHLSPITSDKIDERKSKKFSQLTKNESSSLKLRSRNGDHKISPTTVSKCSSVSHLLKTRRKNIRAISSSSSSSEESDENDKCDTNTQFPMTLQKKRKFCVAKYTESKYSDEHNWKEDTAFELFLQCNRKKSRSISSSEDSDENDKLGINTQMPMLSQNRRGCVAKHISAEVQKDNTTSKYSNADDDCEENIAKYSDDDSEFSMTLRKKGRGYTYSDDGDSQFPLALQKKGRGSKYSDDDSRFLMTLQSRRSRPVAKHTCTELKKGKTTSKYLDADDSCEENIAKYSDDDSHFSVTLQKKRRGSKYSDGYNQFPMTVQKKRRAYKYSDDDDSQFPMTLRKKGKAYYDDDDDDDSQFPMTLGKKGRGSKKSDDDDDSYEENIAKYSDGDGQFPMILRTRRRDCVAKHICTELQNDNTALKYPITDDNSEESNASKLLLQQDGKSSVAKHTFTNSTSCEGKPLPRFVTRKFTSPSKICLDSSSEDSDMHDDSRDNSVNNKNIISKYPKKTSNKCIVDNMSDKEEMLSIERRTAETNLMKKLYIHLTDICSAKTKSKLSFSEDPINNFQKKEISPHFCTTSSINVDKLHITMNLPGESPVRIPVKQFKATFLKMSPEVVVEDLSHQFSYDCSELSTA